MKEIIIFLIIHCTPILIVMELIPQARIYGGIHAEDNQFPYQISLQRNRRHECGGVILTKSFVLTAAHCITDHKGYLKSPHLYAVLAGTSDLDIGGRYFHPKIFILHEHYRCCDRDIALILLNKTFDWDDSIKPIRIYEEELEENSLVTVSGWGFYNKERTKDTILRYDLYSFVSPEKCKKALRFVYAEIFFCLNHPENYGACSGDSGGPATFDNQLVGIAHAVFNPCGSANPDSYVKILNFMDWINNTINVFEKD